MGRHSLTSSLQDLPSKFYILQSSQQGKIPKLPRHKLGDPDFKKFEGGTWEWCDKCFIGSLDRTRITAEHQKRKGGIKVQTPLAEVPPATPQ